MKLNEIMTDVHSQLDQQNKLGVNIRDVNDIPEDGPSNRGVWYRIANAVCVFVDMKSSTTMSSTGNRERVALAYTYFIRATVATFRAFDARFIDIQGDAVFGLFSGKSVIPRAAAAAITIKTLVERDIAERLKRDRSIAFTLEAGVGIDSGQLLVRRLGISDTRNEVWVGNPVNMASKLSSLAGPNQVAVSPRVFQKFQGASSIRQRVLLWSCGCDNGTQGHGLDVPKGQTPQLWTEEVTPNGLGLDFKSYHLLKSKWCRVHGPEFCEALLTGKGPGK